MLAREGLVRPVSLVSSAVDARLVLLVAERRSRKDSDEGCPSVPSSS